MKSEEVRIRTDEQLEIQLENKLRQVIIAAKNKERAEAVETERVQKDRDIEATERERVVSLAQIEKEKAVEIEKRNIQDAIRERVVMEKTVVEEQEKIKDVVALKEANRSKDVALIKANLEAEQALIEDVKAAESREKAAKFDAQKVIIEAGAKKDAADMEADARKIIAEAKAKEEATIGMSEAQVMHAKADANERQGTVDAIVIEKIAEAKRKEGLAEASVIQEKAIAEAKGIQEKAGAMKQLNDAGKEHEEFRLKLNKEKEVQLAEIGIQKDIADAQAKVLAEAFKTAKIDIVGGDNTFFDNLIKQVSNGKGIDKLVENSNTITNFKDALLGGNGEDDIQPDLIEKVKSMATKYGITSEDIKNLSIAALIARVQMKATDEDKSFLSNISKFVSGMGIDQKKLK